MDIDMEVDCKLLDGDLGGAPWQDTLEVEYKPNGVGLHNCTKVSLDHSSYSHSSSTTFTSHYSNSDQ